MKGARESFFADNASIMCEDRSIVEFLDADYTFLNDRLAKHYGIEGVSGDEFRRVSLARGRLKTTLWNVGFIVSEMGHMRPAYLGKEELDVRSKKGLSLPHGAVIAVGAILFLVAGHLALR